MTANTHETFFSCSEIKVMFCRYFLYRKMISIWVKEGTRLAITKERSILKNITNKKQKYKDSGSVTNIFLLCVSARLTFL
jgi:hypothetical protein